MAQHYPNHLHHILKEKFIDIFLLNMTGGGKEKDPPRSNRNSLSFLNAYSFLDFSHTEVQSGYLCLYLMENPFLLCRNSVEIYTIISQTVIGAYKE